MAPIKYRMFAMPYHYEDKPLSQCCDEDLELMVLCDDLGFDEFWIRNNELFASKLMPALNKEAP